MISISEKLIRELPGPILSDDMKGNVKGGNKNIIRSEDVIAAGGNKWWRLLVPPNTMR